MYDHEAAVLCGIKALRELEGRHRICSPHNSITSAQNVRQDRLHRPRRGRCCQRHQHRLVHHQLLVGCRHRCGMLVLVSLAVAVACPTTGLITLLFTALTSPVSAPTLPSSRRRTRASAAPARLATSRLPSSSSSSSALSVSQVLWLPRTLLTIASD